MDELSDESRLNLCINEAEVNAQKQSGLEDEAAYELGESKSAPLSNISFGSSGRWRQSSTTKHARHKTANQVIEMPITSANLPNVGESN